MSKVPGYVPTGETEPLPEMWTPERDGSTFYEDGRCFHDGQWWVRDGIERPDFLKDVPALKVTWEE